MVDEVLGIFRVLSDARMRPNSVDFSVESPTSAINEKMTPLKN